MRFNLSHGAKDRIAVGVCGEVAARGSWRGGGGYGGGRVKRQYRSGFTSLPAFLRLLHHLKSAPHPSLTRSGDRMAKQEGKTHTATSDLALSVSPIPS